MAALKAPFPYFGAKSRVASALWERFGDVANYVEPFCGSAAVLLARPHQPRTETINDADGFVVNFWRAVRADPEVVARHADWPVSEADLHARNYWLVTEGRRKLEALLGDPRGYDAEIAGWWCWGAAAAIGADWCGTGPWHWSPENGWNKGDGDGIPRSLPGIGACGEYGSAGMPGVHAIAGRGDRSAYIRAWMLRLHDRLRDVRICCGDWSRVLKPSVTSRHGGITGIFIDPPYADRPGLYAHGDGAVAAQAREWAIANGANPRLRIALCGYDGEHAMPEGWISHRWKARGGYGSQGDGDGRANAGREIIWFSPHCLRADAQAATLDLFTTAPAGA